MPELPEVEVVRRGLAQHVIGAQIDSVQVLHPRPIRRHEAGAVDFTERLRGAVITDVARRGKFLWLTLDDAAGPNTALSAHLGMSGQLLLQPPQAGDEPHLRVRMALQGGSQLQGRQLRFVDQRMFGGLHLSELIPTADGLPAGVGGTAASADQLGPSAAVLPTEVAHIARDLLDPHLDRAAVVRRMRTRHSGIKRGLLDQRLVSGIGNIYADEALWRARLHYDRAMSSLSPTTLNTVLQHAEDVMREALAQGGTSFDDLYVDVNGASGYFERGLNAYGRAGQPCPRCDRPLRREAFMNRSSYRCPNCQRAPRSH